MNTFEIRVYCKSTTQIPLLVSLFVDDHCFYTGQEDSHDVIYNFEYDETSICEHTFGIKLEGKRQLIDEKNDTETCLEIINLTFDGHDVKKTWENCDYTHNHNGFGDNTVETLSDFMGCDGIARFQFYTPISYWFSLRYPF